jgi:acetylornithine/succinyldiaminopimelate/putrescine aminotransferase
MNTVQKTDSYILHTYKRTPLVISRGKGSWVWDEKGKKYLDFFSGLAVCNLGHAHPAVARAVADQAKKLLHTSNIYFTQPQQALGKALVRRTMEGRVFFSKRTELAQNSKVPSFLQSIQRLLAMKDPEVAIKVITI